MVIVWAVTGPIFHLSDTWQLVINTGTTIVTFLMVFLIQNTQNRDAEAVQIKLDELICAYARRAQRAAGPRGAGGTRARAAASRYCRLAEEARRGVSQGRSDEGVPDIAELK